MAKLPVWVCPEIGDTLPLLAMSTGKIMILHWNLGHPGTLLLDKPIFRRVLVFHTFSLSGKLTAIPMFIWGVYGLCLLGKSTIPCHVRRGIIFLEWVDMET